MKIIKANMNFSTSSPLLYSFILILKFCFSVLLLNWSDITTTAAMKMILARNKFGKVNSEENLALCDKVL